MAGLEKYFSFEVTMVTSHVTICRSLLDLKTLGAFSFNIKNQDISHESSTQELWIASVLLEISVVSNAVYFYTSYGLNYCKTDDRHQND